MLSFSHSFYAAGSDCAVHFFADSAEEFEAFALAAEGEVVRIERRYSRYRADSELSRINAVAARGGSVDIGPETAALMEYARACHGKSGGVFDITSACCAPPGISRAPAFLARMPSKRCCHASGSTK